MAKERSKRYYKDEDLLLKIGKNIRVNRIDKNITQEFLANECEVDYSQINRMELGKVNFTISQLYRIAAVLHIQAKQLLPETTP
jgi:transcriptional regulator with XRE-family HTH domain